MSTTDNPNMPNSNAPVDANLLSVENRQRDFRDRWRALWMPRRDAARQELSQRREGLYLGIDRLTNLVTLGFNYKKPLALIGGGAKFIFDSFTKFIEYKIKTTYSQEDTLNMKSMMWELANYEALRVILDRPQKKDGSFHEIRDLRPVMIGMFNDDFAMAAHPNPKKNAIATNRRIIAEALGHDFDEATGKISDAPIPMGSKNYDLAKFERARQILPSLLPQI